MVALAVNLLFLKSASAASSLVKEDDFIASLATMIEAKTIVQPTLAFVEAQAYDKARTNLQVSLSHFVHVLFYQASFPGSSTS